MPANEKADLMRKRVKEAALVFEHKEGSGLVDVKDLGCLVQRLGVNPTGQQITSLQDELSRMTAGGDHAALLPLDQVEGVVVNFLIQQEAALARDDYHTLIRAFRAFDPEGKGWVDAEALRLLLTSRGETMSEEEVTKMLMFSADGTTGRIHYEDYAQKLATDGRSI